VLREGDWLGGHTLTSERPNVATIRAKGPEPLVTLQMEKEDFEQSGISGKLFFPKRPAMRRADKFEKALGSSPSSHDLASMGLDDSAGDAHAAAKRDADFIVSAIKGNPNLKHATMDVAMLKELAATAECRKVSKGTEVARIGELGQEFFIIRQGLFEVVCDPSESSAGGNQRSAESAVSSASILERMKRKQNFMMQLAQPTDMTDRHSRSLLVKNPKPTGIYKTASLKGTNPNVKQLPEGPTVVATLHAGESFGELSLLYNTRREATYRAGSDGVLYVIDRRRFKQLTHRIGRRQHFREVVDLLTALLRSEREELAANFTDWITFAPGQRILTQGKVRQSPLWYVIYSGSAVISENDPKASSGRRQLGVVCRAVHFGVQSLLEEEAGFPQSLSGSPSNARSESNVDAGPNGLTCVAFDGELIRDLVRGIAGIHSDVSANELSNMLSGRCRVRSSVDLTYLSLTDLHEICILGKGGFGTVFLVEAPDKSQYALKRISKGFAQKLEIQDQLCWEKDLLSMVDSTFVVKLCRTFKDAQFVYLMQEAALGGDLNGAFRAQPEVFIDDRPRGSATRFYIACVIAGLEQLHERRIVYRDIKPENILLSLNGYGKICDMGLARFVFGKTNTQVGTPDFMAPEMIDPPYNHDHNVDWWALGVLAFELLNRHPPFDDEGVDDQEERLIAIRRSQEREPIYERDCPPIARLFIKALLQKIDKGRLGVDGGAKAVRNHNWFKNFNFKALHSQTLPSPVQDLTWESQCCSGTLSCTADPTDEFFVQCTVDTTWDADF